MSFPVSPTACSPRPSKPRVPDRRDGHRPVRSRKGRFGNSCRWSRPAAQRNARGFPPHRHAGLNMSGLRRDQFRGGAFRGGLRRSGRAADSGLRLCVQRDRVRSAGDDEVGALPSEAIMPAAGRARLGAVEPGEPAPSWPVEAEGDDPPVLEAGSESPIHGGGTPPAPPARLQRGLIRPRGSIRRRLPKGRPIPAFTGHAAASASTRVDSWPRRRRHDSGGGAGPAGAGRQAA